MNQRLEEGGLHAQRNPTKQLVDYGARFFRTRAVQPTSLSLNLGYHQQALASESERMSDVDYQN